VTKRKAVPGRRGRKPISDGLRRVIWIRYQKFEAAALKLNPCRLAPDIKNEFIKVQQAWLRSIGIHPGDDRVLSNILTIGRKSAGLRDWNWRISKDAHGKGMIDPLGAYIEQCQLQALGLSPFKFESLGLVSQNKMKKPDLE
jgi:hypothetical protein